MNNKQNRVMDAMQRRSGPGQDAREAIKTGNDQAEWSGVCRYCGAKWIGLGGQRPPRCTTCGMPK